eukprot:12312401-Heterocapsa_arctica.AAC.1
MPLVLKSYTQDEDFHIVAPWATMNFVSSSSQLRAASLVPYKLELSLAHLCSSPSSQSSGGIS